MHNLQVYAEAASQLDADQLAYGAALAVYEVAGGVGSPPEPPVAS